MHCGSVQYTVILSRNSIYTKDTNSKVLQDIKLDEKYCFLIWSIPKCLSICAKIDITTT